MLYYIILFIKDYKLSNAEIFESLHKTYIKNPYHMLNKYNINSQIIVIVSKIY